MSSDKVDEDAVRKIIEEEGAIFAREQRLLKTLQAKGQKHFVSEPPTELETCESFGTRKSIKYGLIVGVLLFLVVLPILLLINYLAQHYGFNWYIKHLLRGCNRIH